ncbi:hypothetical protein [Nocardia abscessus]|uniref:hypothetical protein n=1 Tax=Nocardia abscessus TaxID=120957 RepID=UPI002458DFEF|nr:hypothetical protein [Nocardia abscessus]
MRASTGTPGVSLEVRGRLEHASTETGQMYLLADTDPRCPPSVTPPVAVTPPAVVAVTPPSS